MRPLCDNPYKMGAVIFQSGLYEMSKGSHSRMCPDGGVIMDSFIASKGKLQVSKAFGEGYKYLTPKWRFFAYKNRKYGAP